jgi:hypothetical protein
MMLNEDSYILNEQLTSTSTFQIPSHVRLHIYLPIERQERISELPKSGRPDRPKGSIEFLPDSQGSNFLRVLIILLLLTKHRLSHAIYRLSCAVNKLAYYLALTHHATLTMRCAHSLCYAPSLRYAHLLRCTHYALRSLTTLHSLTTLYSLTMLRSYCAAY